MQAAALYARFILGIRLTHQHQQGAGVFVATYKCILLLAQAYHVQHLRTILSHLFELNEPRPYFSYQRTILISRRKQSISGNDYLPAFLSYLPIGIFIYLVFLLIGFQQGRESRLNGNGLFTTEAMSILSRVGIMSSEDFQIFGMKWHKVSDCMFPRSFTIIILHIPSIISYTVQRDFGSLGMFHRIGNKSRHIIFYIKPVSINRP